MSAVESPMGKELFEFGPFRVDPEKQALLRGGELIALNPKTFQVLLALVRNGNQIITKDELMKSVWPDTFVEETNLTRNIFALRKALGDNDQNRYIITVPGQGYRLAEGVRLRFRRRPQDCCREPLEGADTGSGDKAWGVDRRCRHCYIGHRRGDDSIFPISDARPNRERHDRAGRLRQFHGGSRL